VLNPTIPMFLKTEEIH